MSDLSTKIPLFSVLLIIIYYAADITKLLPCRYREKSDNILYQHICVILITIFTILIFDDLSQLNILQIIKKTIIIYLLFILITKTHHNIFITIIILICITYIVKLRRDEILIELKNKKDPKYEKFEYISGFVLNSLIIFITLLTIVGVFFYYTEKKIEYKKKFDIIKFIFSTNKCRGGKRIPIKRTINYLIK